MVSRLYAKIHGSLVIVGHIGAREFCIFPEVGDHIIRYGDSQRNPWLSGSSNGCYPWYSVADMREQLLSRGLVDVSPPRMPENYKLSDEQVAEQWRTK